MITNGMRPIHPGEILREDFLKPLGLSVNALALALHVPATRLNRIPQRSDIYWIDLNPIAGWELKDRHRFVMITP